MEKYQSFNKALYGVCEDLRNILLKLSPTVKGNVEEIRLRAGLPLAVTVLGETVFIKENGDTAFGYSENLPKATREQIEESFRLLCANSVYAHSEELKEGFVIMKNGCRAGICGTITSEGIMRDISSINIRVSHEIFGASNDIMGSYNGKGLLIAGPPASGKTTVLRDLIRQLSSGNWGKILRVAVIDSRGEISGSAFGESANDLGKGTDILITENRAKGVEIALRTMNPDVIAFDEVGNEEELKSIEASFYSGASVITTAHIGSTSELLSRRVTSYLLKSGIIEQVAILPSLRGGKIEILSAREFYKGVAV